ncbi:MAG: diaminopimelate epimerase [Oscillospiraceae bacterium]|nr:diaminopimelate epimerase [Oscillospiraceae bacterium]
MKLKFTKIQACGNDYIFFDCIKKKFDISQKLIKKLCDRHYGIGGNGVILICASYISDAKMIMFNSDGSEGDICGNGVRGVAKYLFDNYKNFNFINKKIIIETKSRIVEVKNNEGKTDVFTANMGKAETLSKNIPVDIDSKYAVFLPIKIDNKIFKATCISMGNPHCVVFCKNISKINLKEIGPKFENHKIFPKKTNVEFAEILNNKTIKIRVWERGSGETLSCGTGSCATVAAAISSNLIKSDCYNNEILVKLRGGNLLVSLYNNNFLLSGKVEKIFTGSVEIENG